MEKPGDLPMIVTKIGIPTLHCYDKLLDLCAYLASNVNELMPIEVTVIDNGGCLTDDKIFVSMKNLPIPIRVITPGFNLGVAASWNLLIKELGRCFICNDDVLFSAQDIESFLVAATNSPNTVIFNVADPGNHWSMYFVNRPITWLEMGGFDEKFFPAYFEDNDAYHRLELAGLPCKFVETMDFAHDKSSTLRKGNASYLEKHQQTFSQNAIYYQQKWGGMPGRETFTKPFGA